MPRRFVLILALLAATAPARAQNFWQMDDDRPKRATPPEGKSDTAQPSATFPISGNKILGRVQWVDADKKHAVLLLEKTPPYIDDPLIARDASCAPRAWITLVKMANPSKSYACRVLHGELRPGMEVVLPTSGLLEDYIARNPALIPLQTPERQYAGFLLLTDAPADFRAAKGTREAHGVFTSLYRTPDALKLPIFKTLSEHADAGVHRVAITNDGKTLSLTATDTAGATVYIRLEDKASMLSSEWGTTKAGVESKLGVAPGVPTNK